MTANGQRPKHTDRVRELARYIGSQPDELSQPSVHVHVEQTGRHQAQRLAPDELTPADPPPTKPESEEPPSRLPWPARAAISLVKAVNNPYALGALALLVLALFVWLRFR